MRDAEGWRAYASWTWFYRDNGFINLRYDQNRDVANGVYWDNFTNRFSASFVLPLLPDNLIQRTGSVYLQLTGSFAEQNYFYRQPYYDVDLSLKADRRKDRISSGTVSLNWDITKNWGVNLQYTRTNSDSLIPVYEYTRNLYMMGLEFKF